MANNFATKVLRLSNQTLTATGNSLFINGLGLMPTGDYSTNANVASSGQAAWTAANNNAVNLSGNVTTSGQTLQNLSVGIGTNLSGNLTTTGSNVNTRVVALSGMMGQQTMVVPFSFGPVVWTNQPNTGAFFNGSSTYVTKLDLVGFTGVRLAVNMGNVAGAASGALYLGYVQTAFAVAPSSYLSLDTNNTRTRIGVTTTVVDSGWQPIVANARSGVYVALLGSSGSAAVSPQFGMVTAQFM